VEELCPSLPALTLGALAAALVEDIDAAPFCSFRHNVERALCISGHATVDGHVWAFHSGALETLREQWTQDYSSVGHS
jgi:hypothetical protein